METIIKIAELMGAAIAASWITRILTIRSRVRQENAGAAKAETAVKADQIENLEATINKVFDPIIERLTGQVNQLSAKVEKVEAENAALKEGQERLREENAFLKEGQARLLKENAALKAENQELRREVDRLNSQALFRNTNRSRDGKFAPRETKVEKK